MFIASCPTIDYRAPWDRSFHERLTELMRRRRRVAYFYELPDTSTFRYRVYNMVEVINRFSTEVSASWFCREDYPRLDSFLDHVDVLVICRARYEDQLNNLVARAKLRGCRVLFDSDDLVFDTSFAHLVADTLDEDLSRGTTWDYWFAYMGRLGAAAQLCDRVIVTNALLAAQATESTGKEARVVRNFINLEQLEVSRRLLANKRATRYARDGHVHIGYFSGSPSHNKDFAIAETAIARVLDDDPRVHLRLVGFVDVPDSIARFGVRVERHELKDFLNLQGLIASTEINIVPVQDNVFTNCKSELKYFEAGIVGTTTIASPIFAFTNSIQDGTNGRLANAYEWESKIRMVMADLDGQGAAYIAMAEKAAHDAQTRYSCEHQLQDVLAALFD